MRTVGRGAPERLRLTGSVTERQKAIDALMADERKPSKHAARKIEATCAEEECASCGHRVTASDSGARMTTHITNEHGGVGRSFLVL